VKVADVGIHFLEEIDDAGVGVFCEGMVHPLIMIYK
jgi:hypothetical protein